MPEVQAEKNAKSERRFDRQVRVLPWCSPATRCIGPPGHDRFGRDPKADVAALNEGLVVLGPVGDTLLGLEQALAEGSSSAKW